jgi:hypothetical protein
MHFSETRKARAKSFQPSEELDRATPPTESMILRGVHN